MVDKRWPNTFWWRLSCSARLRKAELRCLPDLRTGPEQTWGACYNMAFTRELKNSDYKSPLLILGFGSRTSDSSSSASRSSFSYYLMAEKVRATRRGVQCSAAGGKEFTIQFPLRFHSSIHVFASFYSDVSWLRTNSPNSFVAAVSNHIFSSRFQSSWMVGLGLWASCMIAFSKKRASLYLSPPCSADSGVVMMMVLMMLMTDGNENEWLWLWRWQWWCC